MSLMTLHQQLFSALLFLINSTLKIKNVGLNETRIGFINFKKTRRKYIYNVINNENVEI